MERAIKGEVRLAEPARAARCVARCPTHDACFEPPLRRRPRRPARCAPARPNTAHRARDPQIVCASCPLTPTRSLALYARCAVRKVSPKRGTDDGRPRLRCTRHAESVRPLGGLTFARAPLSAPSHRHAVCALGRQATTTNDFEFTPAMNVSDIAFGLGARAGRRRLASRSGPIGAVRR